MSTVESAPIKQAGSIVLPQGVRSADELKEGDAVILELPAGVKLVFRLAHVVEPPETEQYTPERQAEFLLSNAISEADYQAARDEVLRLGLDPEQIPHYRHSRG